MIKSFFIAMTLRERNKKELIKFKNIYNEYNLLSDIELSFTHINLKINYYKTRNNFGIYLLFYLFFIVLSSKEYFVMLRTRIIGYMTSEVKLIILLNTIFYIFFFITSTLIFLMKNRDLYREQKKLLIIEEVKKNING